MTTSELKKHINHQTVEFGKTKGFFRKKDFLWKVENSSVSFSIGLGFRAYKGNYFVNPTMGVCYTQLQQLYLQLMGYSFNGKIGEPLGYLTPMKTYYEWGFSPTENNDEAFADLFYAMEHYGFSFFERMKELEVYFDLLLKKDRLVSGHINWDLPLIYYLKGEKNKGLEIIEEKIRKDSIPQTDEQILNGTDPSKAIIMGRGGPTVEEAWKMLKKMPSGSQMIFVSGNGVVDPQYLKFAEAYRNLE